MAQGAPAASSGWGGSLGVSSRPDGGLDVQGSFHGTIGGNPTGTTTPAVPISGHSSVGGPVTTGDAPGGTGGGLNSALLAAPLGLAGLGAAALGGRAATTPTGSSDGTSTSGRTTATARRGTTPAGTTPPTTPGAAGDESGWRVLAASDAAGHVNLALVPDTDTVPTALDVGATGPNRPRSWAGSTATATTGSSLTTSSSRRPQVR